MIPEVLNRSTRTAVTITLAVMLSLLTGCGVYKPFQLMDKETEVKPGSVAVISGNNDEATMKIVESLTQELKQRSTFKIMGQDEVARRLGRYPVSIKRAAPKDTDRPVWFAPEEKSRIDGMQAKLGTDYMLIVWLSDLSRWTTTSSQGGSRVSYSASVLGNMLHYPKGRPVAYSNFARSKDQSCFLFGGSEGKDIDALLHGSAVAMADKFIDATKSKKTN